MKDWVLSHAQLTPAHSTQVQFTYLCQSPEHPLGSVEKVCFVSSILATEHLIVLVHDIFDGGLVHVLVDHYRYHGNETVGVRINF